MERKGHPHYLSPSFFLFSTYLPPCSPLLTTFLPSSSPSYSLPLSLLSLNPPPPSFLSLDFLTTSLPSSSPPYSLLLSVNKEDGDGRKAEVMRWMIILQEREER
jgi:hypothetical protein